MKKCYKCQEDKELDQFSKNKPRPDGLSSQCKECHRELRKKHYENNKKKIKGQVKNYKKSIAQFIKKYKTDNPCMDCKITYPYYVMDFDHRAEKNFNISLAARSKGMVGLMEEISKCDLVCANCHRERTHARLI